MSEFYITLARGILHQDFLSAQEEKRQTYDFTTEEEMLCFINEQIEEENEFCINSRLEFLSSVTTYFRNDHAISQETLELRYKEVFAYLVLLKNSEVKKSLKNDFN